MGAGGGRDALDVEGTLAPDGGPGSRLGIDRDRCIACFCCQEMCPEGAIRASAGPLARLLRLGTR